MRRIQAFKMSSDAPDRSRGAQKPGTLFVVATPIGNLEDITLRALRILREVALVAAEDTRRTGNLLRHYEIRTPLLSVHAHNERQRAPAILARLEAGESVALVTDAGTPGISDPGALLVGAARERGFRVEPIPGPSSVVAAISAAGQDAERFCFLGFPPTRAKDRGRFWDRVAALDDFLVVIFEAPHRAQQTLAKLATILGERPIVVARELTKTHEEFLLGTPAEVSERLGTPRGEITILIGPTSGDISGSRADSHAVSDEDIQIAFGQITDSRVATRREAIKAVAERVGLAPKAVYEALERVKNIG